MDQERWRQLNNVLQLALGLLPDDREAYVRHACAGDEALEREIRSLLAAHQEAGSFLESPAIEAAARSIAHRQDDEALNAFASLAGRTISHYRVLEKLGQGGMGVVWKARDTRLDRFVGLKFLPAAQMTDPERRRRFFQEARAASALNHPNIITIYDIHHTELEGVAADFIAMEFVPGKPLNRLISEKGLQLSEVLQYAIQTADALAAAHAVGILHRDLKPGNIMVNDAGCVKVLDFGLAKLPTPRFGGVAPAQTTTEPLKTGNGTIVGTVPYMSPEQAEGKKVDPRSDIFSFGALLYEMITGRRAFSGDSMASILSAILRDRPKPTGEIVPVPRQLDRIVARCLEKDPARRYQHAGDLKLDLQQVSEELAEGLPVEQENHGKRRPLRPWMLAAAFVPVAIVAGLGWRLLNRHPDPPLWKVTQLTSDSGLSGFPALSPDGKLVAYTAESGVNGERDLYVRQLAEGQPVRLTFDGAGNSAPDFSPDGAKIIFRSNRGGGGIYEIPTLGGDVRLIAPDGLDPRYSPDGSQIAYWAGAGGVAIAVPGASAIWVAPVAGGSPRQVSSSFTSARFPIWAPDGKHLLVAGYTSPKPYDASALDWWVVDASTGHAIRTGAYDALVRAGLQARDYGWIPAPGCWSAGDNTVVSSIGSGDVQNLWGVGLSPQTGKVNGELKRLTMGAGNEVRPSCGPGGAVAFTKLETRSDLWALPFDLDRGSPRGPLERITNSPARRYSVSLSGNGHYAAFATQSSGQSAIWLRDLASGKETRVAGSSLLHRFPVVDFSGSRVLYSVYEKDNKRVVYVSAPGGAPEKLCEGCLRATDWSRDEKTILVYGGGPYQIDVLDLATRQQTPLLKHPTYNLLYGWFSPDNRRVSFTARVGPDRSRIAIAPVDGPKPIPESAWIDIAEARHEDWANWSPDGKTLYFTSDRDGNRCLWGQRIDPISHRPAGEPFAAQHLHGRLFYRTAGWEAAAGRIAMVLFEETGNVWLASRSGAH